MNNSTQTSTTMERTEKEKRTLIEALKEMPIVQVACKRAGVGRATYYRWRKEDKQFFRESEDAMGQGFEFINDMSESQIVTLIREKKMPAITLWLKVHHPRYGSNAKPHTAITPMEDLTPEESRIIVDALALTENKIINLNSNDGINSTDPGADPGKPENPAPSGV